MKPSATNTKPSPSHKGRDRREPPGTVVDSRSCTIVIPPCYPRIARSYHRGSPAIPRPRIDSAARLPQPETMADLLDTLEQTIRDRRLGDPATSYVAKLTARGRAKIAQKLGEEATEAVIAAIQDDRAELVKESADLLFHLLVLLADMGLSLDDVRAELVRREGVSGIAEKAARG
ncbi:hypothetical protein GCM10009075_35880 [Sphingomonas trueperi]